MAPGLLHSILKFRVNREFRVESLPLAALQSSVESAGGVAAQNAVASNGVSDQIGSELLDQRALANLCTGVWRVRKRLVDPATGLPRDEMRMPYRHLESVWDTLVAAGIEIRDHTGDPIPEYGSVALEVLAYQPTSGISRSQVVDTVKPSVYMGGQLLQMGQVIVGTPEGVDGTGGEGTTS